MKEEKITDKAALPRLKEEFLPLVEGLTQVSEKFFKSNVHNLEEQKNTFTVDFKGELRALYIFNSQYFIDWELLVKCKSLNKLILQDLDIEFFPEYLLKLTSLKELSITQSKLKKLPHQINQLESLEALDLSGNCLCELPSSFFKLKMLERLDLDSNEFHVFPDEVVKIKGLSELSLSNNKIKTIPPSIVRLRKLQILVLSNNLLSELPDNIFKLDSLFCFVAEKNKIHSIPDSIGDAKKLKFLIIRHNMIDKIPDRIIELKNIDHIDLRDNLLPIPDLAFNKLNTNEKIQTLLAIQSSDSYPLKQAKILVVGDERVGKTSIINRLLGNQHDENQTSTQGIDISSLDFDEYKAHIWDFAGQELTHQTHQFFLTERSLYIYVLDAQKEDNQARDLHWFNTIKSYSENSPIIVVVNHCDQNLNYQFDLQRYQSVFQVVDVIHTSACNLNSLSEEVKCKIGDSIGKLNKSILKQLPKLPGIERQLPESWHIVKSAMETFKETHNVIEKDAYEDECRKAGVMGIPLQTALLKILNSIGTVIAYPNDFRLKLTQILKPEWVTNAVYKIVRSPAKTPGIYTEEAIGDILKEAYTPSQQQWLIDLLIKFELGFRLSSNSDLLIPMRLPSVMPEFDKSSYQRGLNIRFNYHRIGLLKLNVLPQLIVRMHPYVDENTTKYWRHGLFLIYNECRGVVISDEPNQCIDVFLSTRDEDARSLLQWLRSNLKKIEHSQIQANGSNEPPYKEEIAIFDDNSPHPIGYVNYEKVERAHKKGKSSIEVEVTCFDTGAIDDIDIEVSKLLGLYKTTDLSYNMDSLINVISSILLRLTDSRSKIIDEKEDDINDRLRESLTSAGYFVRDQSRGGFSGSGKSTGERDLVMLDQFGLQATLIEAMCLNSAVKETINSHYNKLVNNYNTQGNQFDFLITYAKVKNFNTFWENYQKCLDNFISLPFSNSKKTSVKVGITTVAIDGSDETRTIVHIAVNFGVKP